MFVIANKNIANVYLGYCSVGEIWASHKDNTLVPICGYIWVSPLKKAKKWDSYEDALPFLKSSCVGNDGVIRKI